MHSWQTTDTKCSDPPTPNWAQDKLNNSQYSHGEEEGKQMEQDLSKMKPGIAGQMI